VLSGVSHPEVDGGHQADVAFLTAAPHPGSSSFRNTISLDQLLAEKIGHHTRFPSLPLLVGVEGRRSLSWSRSGVMIPGEKKPSAVFAKLFVQGTPKQIDEQIAKLRDGRSVLDSVREGANDLNRKLGPTDRTKLDQYLTARRGSANRSRRPPRSRRRTLPTPRTWSGKRS
jgi:hypothetical protein